MRLGPIWKRHATRLGVTAGAAALLLWPAFASMGEPLRLPFVAVLVLTLVSGGVILSLAGGDLLTVRRGRHARAARTFDLVLGLILVLPPLAALIELVG